MVIDRSIRRPHHRKLLLSRLNEYLGVARSYRYDGCYQNPDDGDTGVAYARHRCVDPEGWLNRGIWEDT